MLIVSAISVEEPATVIELDHVNVLKQTSLKQQL